MNKIKKLNKMKKDYSRDGHSLMTLPVAKFNAMVKAKDSLMVDRKLTNWAYLYFNRYDELRKVGYVAFTSNATYFGKTKKEAMENYKRQWHTY